MTTLVWIFAIILVWLAMGYLGGYLTKGFWIWEESAESWDTYQEMHARISMGYGPFILLFELLHWFSTTHLVKKGFISTKHSWWR